MAKLASKFRINVTVPEGMQPGDTFQIEVTTPELPTQKRIINNKPVEEMTDEELKREIINANSVYYKAKQKTDDESVLEPKLARLEAAKAERERRAIANGGAATANGVVPVVSAEVVTAEDASVEGAAEDDVYASEEADAAVDAETEGEI